jgi:DeoR/GlpR family transcriptional regulator of sugar metabolism
MHPHQRRQTILEYVRAHGVASLHELADAVGASEATIRRDLRELDAEGLLRRHRGAASWPETLAGVSQSAVRPGDAAETGFGPIAAEAARLAASDDAVAVGAGPGTRELARELARTAGLTVVTNSLVVALELATSDVEVIVTGGTADGGQLALVGTAVEESLRAIRVRRAFVSADGITADRGPSMRNPQLASTTRALMACAQETVVLAIHDAVGVDSTISLGPVESVTHLVTDLDEPDDALDALRRAGVAVRTTSEPGDPAEPHERPAELVAL